ncbi:hypothetical protein LX16_0947 [Stackebrandtia albiflava]|uniref:Uncharacterized protein n=1 Tax=Stackebrandtia albiflava TaxID=406432 RepID=A0A562VBP7_9ACTN|nr:hypothetical protein [Stackebrandtia albiflava]TWJ15247.1 hypothetical protein LX16_0947 [Stackebrandtia albiflava]
MDGIDSIDAERIAVQPTAVAAASGGVDHRPHLPDVVRGERCQICRTDWPCAVVHSRRPR